MGRPDGLWATSQAAVRPTRFPEVESFMLRRLLFTTAALLCLGLSACGGTMPSASNGSGSSGSGITVFGEIDAGVSHTR